MEVDHASALWGIIGASVIAVAGAVGMSIKRIVEKRTELYLRRMERAEQFIRGRTSAAFTRMAKFYHQVDLIKAMDNVERVLLFFGKDDGGLPDPTKRYTVICRHGWATDGRKNPEGDYNFELLVDRDYCEMLAQMVRDGRITNTTEDMPPRSLLRKYYEIEGVKQSVLYFLHIDPEQNELMFLSVGTYGRPFTDDEVKFIDVRVDRMRAILSPDGDGSDYHNPLAE